MVFRLPFWEYKGSLKTPPPRFQAALKGNPMPPFSQSAFTAPNTLTANISLLSFADFAYHPRHMA